MRRYRPSFVRPLKRRYTVGLIIILGVGGFFLWQGLKAQIIEYWPYLLLIGAWVGLHFFMHGSHGNAGRGKDPTRKNWKDFNK